MMLNSTKKLDFKERPVEAERHKHNVTESGRAISKT